MNSTDYPQMMGIRATRLLKKRTSTPISSRTSRFAASAKEDNVSQVRTVAHLGYGHS
jgi:hypothetical protein